MVGVGKGAHRSVDKNAEALENMNKVMFWLLIKREQLLKENLQKSIFDWK
jgi:hypothetical protein